jgi:hypothetical protein
MVYLIDRLFEGMPLAEAKAFPLEFVKSIPVGKDLEPVMDRFLLSLLSDPEQGVMLSASESVRPAIQTVIDLYKRQVEDDYPSIQEYRAAAGAAACAAACAAYRAADSTADSAESSAAARAAARAAACAAASAAVCAAYSAAASTAYRAAYSAAYSAAESVAESVAYRAACSNHYLWQSVILISLLKSA